MAYQINAAGCSCCHQCKVNCPVSAIRFKGSKYWIDPDKCIDCGICADICHNCVISKVGEEPKAAEKHELIKRECDVLVVGGGGSGLIAAAKAACETGKKVIVIEKSKKCGGNTWYAGGFRIHYSKLLAEAGEPDNRMEDIRKFMIDTLWAEDHHLVYNVYHATEHLCDWMREKCGCEDNFVVGTTPWGGKGLMVNTEGAPKFKRPDTSIGPGGGGSFIVWKMLEMCKQFGVEILTEHAATKLITDDTGAVTGVLASDPGGETEISCKVCIMSTGCFSHDPELQAKANPTSAMEGEPIHYFSVPSCTGDGIKMASAIGADIDYKNMKALSLGPAHHPFGFAGVCISRENEVMFVNANGKRWANETDNTMVLRHRFLEQPKFINWAVCDSNIAKITTDRLIQMRRDGDAGVALFKNYLNEIEEECQLDTPTKKADTLEELAQLMGVPADTFVAEVERYNQFCRTGNDEDFFKAPEYMVPIEKPPFYAFFGKRFQENAAGGMKVNSDLQVLNSDGNPIKGLYATGDNCRGVLIGGDVGTDYVERMISACTFACASGYIAGENVIKYLDA